MRFNRDRLETFTRDLRAYCVAPRCRVIDHPRRRSDFYYNARSRTFTRHCPAGSSSTVRRTSKSFFLLVQFPTAYQQRDPRGTRGDGRKRLPLYRAVTRTRLANKHSFNGTDDVPFVTLQPIYVNYRAQPCKLYPGDAARIATLGRAAPQSELHRL